MSTEDFKAAVKAGNLSRAISIAQEIMNRRFDIAVIGKAGSGASNFINAIKDLKNYDTGAAQIALVGKRTNRSPTSYRHPRDPKLYFCDMPEIPCSDFKADKYFEQVGFDPYDLFIIIASEPFMYIHTELAKEIQRRGKSFYFVYSKGDDVLYEMAEESSLRRIREECTERLQIGGLTDHQVFIISSRRLSCYDFPLLKETLLNNIFSQETEKLLDISQSTLQEKKKGKWMPAIGNSVQAGGVATGVWLTSFDKYDADIVIDIIKGYYKYYGLDDDSLSMLAGHAGQDVKDLKAVMTCPQASEITTNCISDILIKYTPIESKVLRRVPVLGGLFCMARTCGVMLRFLNDLTENTNRVLRKALEGKGRKPE